MVQARVTLSFDVFTLISTGVILSSQLTSIQIEMIIVCISVGNTFLDTSSCKRDHYLVNSKWKCVFVFLCVTTIPICIASGQSDLKNSAETNILLQCPVTVNFGLAITKSISVSLFLEVTEWHDLTIQVKAFLIHCALKWTARSPCDLNV
jgi:hypothetical protein